MLSEYKLAFSRENISGEKKSIRTTASRMVSRYSVYKKETALKMVLPSGDCNHESTR